MISTSNKYCFATFVFADFDSLHSTYLAESFVFLRVSFVLRLKPNIYKGKYLLREVVGTRLRHRLRRGEQGVGKLWRMRQGAGCLRPATICHQPAGNGDCDSYQSQKSCYYQGYDESDHWDADVFHPLSTRSWNKHHTHHNTSSN